VLDSLARLLDRRQELQVVTAERDAHSEMLRLALALVEREGEGQRLSEAQRAISDVMWLGTQVSPNGFDGWLAYTTCARMRRTLEALAEIGSAEVASTVRAALAVAGVDPLIMGDEERQRRLDALTDADRGLLEPIDRKFHDLYEPSMLLCQRYAQEHGLV
jgi:hypothetical protein